MKNKLMAILATGMLIIASGGSAQATTIDFTADAFRGGNTTDNLPTITENILQNGFTVQTDEAGQKASYGTDYFDGWQLNKIDSIRFTFKNGSSKSPYSNLTITDGSGAYGVISSQGGILSDIVDNLNDPDDPYYQATRTFFFAGDAGNNNYGFKFYEPVNAPVSWTHGSSLVWNDISSWYLLGINDTRPLYNGEVSSPRAPTTTGLNLIWGDSAANYIGAREVWDVVVIGSDDIEYRAGVTVPEPCTMFLFGIGLAGFFSSRVKQKKKAV